jgi:hypothetical protein
VCSATGQGRPQGLFITPQSNRAVAHTCPFSAGAPDAPVVTDRTRSTASGAPAISNSSVRTSNGHCAPTVKRHTGRAVANHRTHRCAQFPRARRHHRTRSSQPPDATVPASGASPVSARDHRTRPMVCHRTRTASDDFVTRCSPDRTRRSRGSPDAPVSNPSPRA